MLSWKNIQACTNLMNQLSGSAQSQDCQHHMLGLIQLPLSPSAIRRDPLAAGICSEVALSCRCRPTGQNAVQGASARVTIKVRLVNKWCGNCWFETCKQIGHVTPIVDILRHLLPSLIKIWGCRSISIMPMLWFCERTLYSLDVLGKGFSDAIEKR